MPDAFDLLDDAVTTDKGQITDYEASRSELFAAGLEESLEAYNPTTIILRQMDFLNEDLKSLAGITERIDQKTAQAEVARRNLDLKIPVGGMSRPELDGLQYLKQRELARRSTYERPRPIGGTASMLGGSLAGAVVDPINVASAFIPIVPEARYAQWLARAGEGAFARAGVRAGAGAIEGTVGAALIEPIVYAGATSEQADYGLMDSFLNVTLGGVLGGGLHTIGGAVYDRAVPPSRDVELRDVAGLAPEHVKRDAMQAAVEALERGDPVDVEPVFERHIQQPGSNAAIVQPGTVGGARVPLDGGAREGILAFHGTGSDFAEFAVPETRHTRGAGSPESAIGIWFTDNPDAAHGFADFSARGEGANVRRVVLDIQNPLRVANYDDIRDLVDKFTTFDRPGYVVGGRQIRMVNDVTDFEALRKSLRDQGYDGIILEKTKTDSPDDGETLIDQYIVFDPAQIKHAVAAKQTAPGQPRGLADLIPEARADRTADAFTRQFVDEVTETAQAEKAKPKDRIEAAKTDGQDWGEIVDQFREQGRVTEADDKALKQADELGAWAERRAKAFEAAASCLTVA